MSLLDCPLGCVPILWNNADLLDLAPEVEGSTVLDEIARLGFAGTQHGRGLPEGQALRDALSARSLRFAELYSALEAGPDGVTAAAADLARRDLGRLIAAGGEVLVVAVHGSPERDRLAGRVGDGGPRWPERAFDDLARLLGELTETAAGRARVAFHPHGGTWVENPAEVAAIADRLPGTGAGLCLDVGHYVVGGGDPAEAIERYRDLVTHVHLKDVDGDVLRRLRGGELESLTDGIRERIFTEAGNGILDLDGVLRALDRIGYAGWLMVEQDTSWLPPSEAAAIGRRVVEYARRLAVREAVV